VTQNCLFLCKFNLLDQKEKGCFTNESESSSAASSEKIGKSKLNDIHLEESFGSEVSNLNDAVKNPDISSKSNQVGEDKKRFVFMELL